MSDSRPANWDSQEGTSNPASTAILEGHEKAAAQICQAFASGRLHHAWLLHGPKGIGKATFAFRLAEYMFRNPAGGRPAASLTSPDDSLHSQVAQGGHPGLLAISRPYDHKTKKFKTKITAPEMRADLQRFLGNSASSPWRVVIVDSADDLNAQSANALLKHLEEPPRRTVFLVIAQTPRGLLPTIRSRCQVLPMRPLEKAAVKAVLSRQDLTRDLPDEMTEQIVELAQGSPGRAMLLADGEVLELFRMFREAVQDEKPDIPAIHQIAGKLSLPSRQGQLRLFVDLVHQMIIEIIHDTVASGSGGAAVSQWPELWQKTAAALARAEAYNMDRKQVVLNLALDMNRQLAGAA